MKIVAEANRSRRVFLKNGLALAAIGFASYLLKPLRALAAEWPKNAFESKKIDEALQSLFGGAQATTSASIRINAPYQAENGATVRFVATIDLPNVSTVAVLVEKNERPLVMTMNYAGAEPYISLRLKMAQTSDVYVVAKSQGKLYIAKQNIKVTVGGCG